MFSEVEYQLNRPLSIPGESTHKLLALLHSMSIEKLFLHVKVFNFSRGSLGHCFVLVAMVIYDRYMK